MFRKLWVTEHFDVNPAHPIYKNVVDTNTTYLASNKRDPVTSVMGLSMGTGIAELEQKLKISDQTQRSINFCKSATLDTLVANQTPTDNLRCGWIYKKRTGSSVPEVSQGAYGTPVGPVAEELPAGARWFWNLEKARDEVQKDLCMSMTSCGDLQNTMYAGKCVWDSVAGKGIPTLVAAAKKKDGASGIITSAGSCPPGPKVPGVCDADPARGLSIACLSQMNQQAGCSKNGTIAAALASSTDAASFARELVKKPAYQRWRDTTAGVVDPSVFSQGSAASQVALQEFQRIQIAATTKKGGSGTSAAARDLCLGTEKYEDYDFCSELNDSTRAPFPLECLQKLWVRSGGLETGKMYPSNKTKGDWDKLAKWSAVKSYIQQLKTSSNITDIQNFIGVNVAAAPAPAAVVPYYRGIELFWYDYATGTLIGRILTNSFANIPVKTASAVLSFTAFTNIRPSTDMDVNPKLTVSSGKLVTADNYAKSFYDFDAKAVPLTSCTKWKKDSDANILAASWTIGAGQAPSSNVIQYSECVKRPTQNAINPEWLTLTQEPYAPFYAFELWKRPNQNGELVPTFSERRQFNTNKNSVKTDGPVPAVTLSGPSYFNKPYITIKGNTVITCGQPIAYSAVGNITLALSFNDLPSPGAEWTILNFKGVAGHREIRLILQNGKFMLVSKEGSTKTSVAFGLPLVKGQWYFISLRFNKKENQIIAAAMPFPITSKNIPASILDASHAGVKIQSATPLAASFMDDARNAGRLVLNQMNQGTNMNIAWIHLFDYEFTAEMDDVVNKEARQTWNSSWFL